MEAATPPKTKSFAKLRGAAAECLVCPWAKRSTQTVFGEGPARASIMIVGEQPGDKEDLTGHPFVGPAGRVLDEALAEAGIPRTEIYVTNAVKHFKFEPRGKFRLHQKPNGSDIKACHPWLESELATVKPVVVVALGATAAQSVCGRVIKVTQARGRWIEGEPRVLVSWHPSAILRAQPGARDELRAQLRSDLAKVWKFVKGRA